MSSKTAFDQYSSVEFDRWAHYSAVNGAERTCLECFLDKNGRTLDAGTGGGRILFELHSLGFRNLFGFDFVPAMVDLARDRAAGKGIDLRVLDARQLDYPDCCFDQVVYLQQLIGIPETPSDRLMVAREACRVLRVGGVALFSFLNYEGRSREWRYVVFLEYLSLLRRLRGDPRTVQYIPWMHIGGRPNLRALVDASTCSYWFTPKEIWEVLECAGFTPIGIGGQRQVCGGSLCSSYAEMTSDTGDSVGYVVCRR